MASVVLAAAAAPVLAHPGVAPDARCSSCHVDKTRGKSVHSAMAISCMVCHVITGTDQKTSIELTAPKEKICFGCHEQSAQSQQHTRKLKGICVDCHDSHSSPRRMLLLKSRGSKRP